MKFDSDFWLHIVILIDSLISIFIGIKFKNNYNIFAGIMLFIVYLLLLMRWYEDHDLK